MQASGGKMTVIQRVVAPAQHNGPFNPNAAKPNNEGDDLPDMENPAYGGTHTNNTGLSGGRDGIHNAAYGSGVGNTRPDDWAELLRLSNNNNPWRQLHLLNDNLGGRGLHTNLVPGSASFNGQHLGGAETPVKNWAGSAEGDVDEDRAADYEVTANYNNPDIISNYIIENFHDVDNFAGTIEERTDEEMEEGDPELVREDVYDQQRDALKDEHEDWISDYVSDTFASSFTCTAKFYERDDDGDVYSTNQQNVTVSYQ
ncbi:MAG: hypothetical protein FD123_1878 [Bacteroidetes bacterium]|nr:MAG: hypothetical protein FD123_1878 [Bacteroidota bacterium]